MSRNRFILHIGLPKTGSTAIQSFLRLNNAALESKGIKLMRGSGLWKPIPGIEEDRTTSEREWREVRGHLKKMNLLYSNESLAYIFLNEPGWLDEIQQYIGNAKLELIIYLRRQDLHAESLYREILKQHEIETPFSVDHLKRRFKADIYDYHAMLTTFAEHVAKENILVRVYDWPKFVGGDVISDFLSVIGVPYDKTFARLGLRANPSADARLIPYFSVAKSQWEVHNQAGELFNEMLLHGCRELFPVLEHRVMSLETRQELLEKYAASNARVAAEYAGLGETPLFPPLDPRRYSDIKKFTSEDHAKIALFIHNTWSASVGAIPFPLYNFKKLQHLRQARLNASGGKKLLFGLRIAFHALLHGIGSTLSLKAFPYSYEKMERKLIHYLLRTLRMPNGDSTTEKQRH